MCRNYQHEPCQAPKVANFDHFPVWGRPTSRRGAVRRRTLARSLLSVIGQRGRVSQDRAEASLKEQRQIPPRRPPSQAPGRSLSRPLEGRLTPRKSLRRTHIFATNRVFMTHLLYCVRFQIRHNVWWRSRGGAARGCGRRTGRPWAAGRGSLVSVDIGDKPKLAHRSPVERPKGGTNPAGTN